MTAPPAALCGHRWDAEPFQPRHECQLDADHTDRCRCRCGALTPEET